MIELYGMASPNVQKVILMLAEVGLPYTLHPINVAAGEQYEPGFVRLNPNSRVPVIVDGDGPDGRPVTVFESGAILIYLAEKSGRLLPADGRARIETLEWLMIQLTAIGPMTGQYVHFRRYAPQPQHYSLSRYRNEMLRLWEVLDGRLAQREYLAGESYSIADVATWPWLASPEFLDIEPTRYVHVQRWSQRIASRPAAHHLRQRLAELIPRFQAELGAAAPEQLDRFFGRGAGARD
jgi:GST-like protein